MRGRLTVRVSRLRTWRCFLLIGVIAASGILPARSLDRSPGIGSTHFRLPSAVIPPSQPFDLEYFALPGNTQDWITVAKASDPATTYGQWFFTQGKKDGTFRFNGLPEGDYEVRVFFDWPNGQYNVRDRLKFRVGGPDAAGGEGTLFTGAREVHTYGVAGTWTPFEATRSAQGAIPNDAGWSFFVLPRPAPRSTTFTARIRFRNGVDYNGAGFALVDPASTHEIAPHIRIELSERQNTLGIGGWLDRTGNHYAGPSLNLDRDIRIGEWYSLKLQIDGTRVRGFLDGAELLSADVPSISSLPAELNPALFVIEADVEFELGDVPGSAAGTTAPASGPSTPPTVSNTPGALSTNLGMIVISITLDEHGSPQIRVTGPSGELRTSDLGNLVIELIRRTMGATGEAQPPASTPAGARIVVEDDVSSYSWYEGTPETRVDLVSSGGAAYRATGNNHFYSDLGRVGDGAGEYRYIEFDLYLLDDDADIQLQIQNNGSWGNRWGFDVEPTYNGYGWYMAGTTGSLKSGRWLRVRRDLVDGMKMAAGDRITGLAFSSDHGDALFDRVVLLPASAVFDLPVAASLPDTAPRSPGSEVGGTCPCGRAGECGKPDTAPVAAAATPPPTVPTGGVGTVPPQTRPAPPATEPLAGQCVSRADETACLFDATECPCRGRGSCGMSTCSGGITP